MTFGQKLAYSMGSFANTLCYQAFQNRIKIFYLSRIDVGTYSLIWFIWAIWNAINDPLMGAISDRTRSRWGRRIPYLLFGSIPLGISFLVLWTPPAASPFWVAVYLFVALFVFDTLFSLLIVAYNAMFPGLTSDIRERTSLSGLREQLAAVAMLLALALSPAMVDVLGYVGFGLLIGSLTAAGYLVAILGSRKTAGDEDNETVSLLAGARQTLSNPLFPMFLGANLSKELIFAVLTTTLPLHAKYVLRLQNGNDLLGLPLSAGLQEGLLLGIPILAIIPALALWARIAPGLTTRVSWMWANILLVPGLVILGLASSANQALLGTILLVPGLAGIMMLPHVGLAEVIDDDIRRTQKHREGLFIGFNGAAIKLAFGLQALLDAAFLWSTGFDGSLEEQSASAEVGIRLLIAAGPILAAFAGILFLWLLGRVERRTEDGPEPE